MAVRGAQLEVPNDDVTNIIGDLLQRLAGIDEVTVRYRRHEVQIRLTLASYLFERQLHFPRLQRFGRRVEEDDQVRLGNHPPNQANQPQRSPVAIAPLVHQHIDEMPIGEHQR